MSLPFPDAGSQVGSPGKCAHTTYTWVDPSEAISGSQSSPPQNPSRVAPAATVDRSRPGTATPEVVATAGLTFGGSWSRAAPLAPGATAITIRLPAAMS